MCHDATVTSDGLQLKGWQCQAEGARRGTIVYLHGIADNRSSAVGAIERFTQRGFDAVAYDSRANGESDGDICTYGFFEKRETFSDLRTVAVERAPVFFASGIIAQRRRLERDRTLGGRDFELDRAVAITGRAICRRFAETRRLRPVHNAV
jgi:pimeloyl-ACP methyl ester carboxylesterase